MTTPDAVGAEVAQIVAHLQGAPESFVHSEPPESARLRGERLGRGVSRDHALRIADAPTAAAEAVSTYPTVRSAVCR